MTADADRTPVTIATVTMPPEADVDGVTTTLLRLLDELREGACDWVAEIRRLCDGCGTAGPPAPTSAEAIDLARAHGWLSLPDADLCPNCAHEEDQ